MVVVVVVGVVRSSSRGNVFSVLCAGYVLALSVCHRLFHTSPLVFTVADVC